MIYLYCLISLGASYVVSILISNLLVKKVNSDYEKLKREKAEINVKWIRWSRREK